jgi:hypothetical protein
LGEALTSRKHKWFGTDIIDCIQVLKPKDTENEKETGEFSV